MTAFDNIKVNNWPATSNEFEDFLVLKMPLNDNASLTESLPVVAGSKELFPKQTLTNTGVSQVQPRSVVNVKLHTYIYNTPSTLKVNGNTVPRGSDPNGDVTFTVAVNGGLSSIAWSYDSGSGPYCYMKGIEVDLGDGNGYQLIQDGAFGVSAYSSLISGTVDSNYPLSNLFGGTIGTGYTNGTRHTNPGTLTLNLSSVFPAKKHYNNSADFGSTSQDKHLTVPASYDFQFGNDPWCIECWAYIRGNPTNGTALWDFNTGAGFSGSEEWICAYHQSTNMYFYWGATSGYYGINATLTADQWQHWAWTWDGTTARLFRDGTLAASTTTTNKTSGWGSATRNITIGKQNYDSPNRFGDQQMQDLRIYKGTAKYTSNFTPPGAILS